MNYRIMDFTKLLKNAYKNGGITTESKTTTIYYIEPIIKLPKEVEEHLLKGDGQKNKNEYKQINSSTGLAVNYYKILEDTGNIEKLRFEEKVEKPLKIKGGRKANLDVAYKREGKQYYIESKFLEPYYSGNEHNTESYFKKEFYDVPDNDKDAWYTLLVDAQNYKIYNFSQICRHLMAIWRKHKEDKQLKIVFQSVMWKMTEKFIENTDNEEDKEVLRSRIIVIDEEAKSAKSRIDKFLADIGWKNITFESVYYNDILEDISSSKYCSEFKQRYFL